jgi:hypothetical protein
VPDQGLTEAEALAVLAEGDPRPLLVLRECENCAGTEDAFLSRELDNEKTLLLGRWFHAVKFPQGVIDPAHPLHELFAGKSPPHLFTVTADGKSRVDLDGRQSQAQLWRAMTSVLRKSYRKDPEAAQKALSNLLDRLDGLDSRLADLEERFQSVRAGGKGPDSQDVKDLEEERTELTAQRQALLEEGRAMDDLQLRQP